MILGVLAILISVGSVYNIVDWIRHPDGVLGLLIGVVGLIFGIAAIRAWIRLLAFRKENRK